MEHSIATRNDLQLLAELNSQLMEDEGHESPMSVLQLQRRMRSWLTQRYTAVLFWVDGEVVGYALFRPDELGIHLRHFFICRQHRRRGYGRAAMAILLEKHWPNDATVTLDVLYQNQRALSFWRSLGFTDYALTLRRRGS